MAKLLSVAVPCYNSAAYMSHCIDTLLTGGEDVEILVVDDGSTKDNTAAIADEYAAKYPTIVRAIHQENGGHGEAVNAGLRNATGYFFKVVDSDDWVNEEAYAKLLQVMRSMVEGNIELDLLISNFVYEKEGKKHKKVMSYRNVFPTEQIISWEDAKHFRLTQYILMHSVIYRTQLLKNCGLVLPKHTFYVDNIFVFTPLPYVKTMYYVDVNFYRYYIGREDQSVNEKVMIGRIDQQIRVNKIMIDDFVEQRKKHFMNRHCHRYMMNYLNIMMEISSIMLILSETDENYEKKKELWSYLKKKDFALWARLRFSVLGTHVHLPGKMGRKVTKTGYKIARRFIGFN